MEDVNVQSPSLLDFSDLSHPHESQSIQRSLKFLKAPSEQSASVVENPLESSVEVGVDATLSSSHGNQTGSELMEQHLGRGSIEGGGLMAAAGGQRSAFFKPIGLKTDEEKLGQDSNTRHFLFKPTPRIYLNENELQISPISPPPPLGQHTKGGRSLILDR